MSKDSAEQDPQGINLLELLRYHNLSLQLTTSNVCMLTLADQSLTNLGTLFT